VSAWLGEVNLVLAVFNMLPALPLDGGRVLRALLWARRGDFAAATRRAGTIAEAIGQMLVAVGVALFVAFGAVGGPWLALIGWFVLAAARSETAYGTMREALTGLRVADAMITEPATVAADATLLDFLEGTFARAQYAAYPVTHGGNVVGILAVGDVEAVPPSLLGRTLVRDRMLALGDALRLDSTRDLADAVTDLLQTPLRRALVTHGGRVVGLLSLTDAEQLIERHSQRPAG
jgi:CBS domain-containing protein